MNKKPIPVLGVLILNGPKWLQRQIDSVDYPVENYLIINNNGKGELDDDINAMISKPHPFIKNFKLATMPYNIGCAAGWNMIIKTYMNEPYWIIANHDVSFSEGFLEEMHDAAQDDTVGLVHGNEGDFKIGSFDLFLIKDWVVQSHGLFDENIYPCYGEDSDYIMRLQNNPVKRVWNLERDYYHGEGTEYYETGMNTKKYSQEMMDGLNYSNEKNFEYLYKKWGPGWRTLDNWKHPFNIEGLDPRTTIFDLEFCRDKHLGF